MFRKNERLRAAEEVWDYTPEEVQEYIRCATDFVYWAERYAKISTLDHGIQLVRLRDYQRRMVNEIVKLEAEGKRGMVVLAPRQCGKTTGIHLYLTWQANFYDTQSIAIIANKSKNAMKILRSIKQTIEYMPLWMQAGCVNGGWNKLSIELGNGSQVITGTAQNEAIRGGTFHCVTGDSMVSIRFKDGSTWKINVEGLYSRDESKLIKVNNKLYSKNEKSVHSKQVLSMVRGSGEPLLGTNPGNGIPSHNSQVIGGDGRLTQPGYASGESSFGGTSASGENHDRKPPVPYAIRILPDVFGSPRKNGENELGKSAGIPGYVVGSTKDPSVRNQSIYGNEDTDGYCIEGQEGSGISQEDDRGCEPRTIARNTEDPGTSPEDSRCVGWDGTSMECENQQKSGENSEDGGSTSWNETERGITSQDECFQEGKTIDIEGSEGHHFRGDPTENEGVCIEENIQPGSLCWEDAQVLTASGWKPFLGCVLNGYKMTYKLVLANGMSIRTTDDHQIHTMRGWVKHRDLRAGDLISTVDGFVPFSESVKVSVEAVYDLVNVEHVHSFYANGILVHNCIYLDEYAFIPKHAADDFMKSVLPSIMAGKNTRIFATSTPKGMNQFWTMWRKAESGKSMFKAFRIRYEEVPGYGNPEFKRQIVDTEGIMTWKQEFECAFLGSSKTLIQPEYIEASKPVDPIRIEFNDWLHIWENPIKGAMYILGVDVAKGVGGDYSVIQVVKIEGLRKLTQVARFSCNTMNLDDFAQVCISISKFYNFSELIVENNDLGGVLTGKIADVYQYDHLVSYEKGFWGVRAGRKSKAIGNSYLRDYVENGWVVVNDAKAWSEFATYEELRDNIFAAIPGNHDDQVMSLMWAVYYVISSADLDDEVETQINPRFRIGNGQYEDQKEADDNFHGDWMSGGNHLTDDTVISRATNYHAASPDIQALFGGRGGGGEADMFSMIGDDFGGEYDLH